MTKKKKEHCLDIKISGDDLDGLIRDYIKEKLGDIDIKDLEVLKENNYELGILNSDVERFNIFIKYQRK